MYLNNAAQSMAHSKLSMNGIFIMAMRSEFYNDANTHFDIQKSCKYVNMLNHMNSLCKFMQQLYIIWASLVA